MQKLRAIGQPLLNSLRDFTPIILDSAVGRGEVCVCRARRNDAEQLFYSLLPESCLPRAFAIPGGRST